MDQVMSKVLESEGSIPESVIFHQQHRLWPPSKIWRALASDGTMTEITTFMVL